MNNTTTTTTSDSRATDQAADPDHGAGPDHPVPDHAAAANHGQPAHDNSGQSAPEYDHAGNGQSEQDDTDDGRPSLKELGLAEGEPVRWRRQAGARWHQGTVIQREADGSVAVRDSNSAWRSLPVDRLEVQMVTKRGAKRWTPLSECVDRVPDRELWSSALS